MSSKTRTRTPRTTGTDRVLRSVADESTTAIVRTETEDALWAALHANPNTTTADLATLAKIGKSTAGKFLARWAGEGSVTRTPGIAVGGRRAADVWAIAETAPAVDGTDSDAPADGATADEPPLRAVALGVAAPDDQISATVDPDPVDAPIVMPAGESEAADGDPADVVPEATQGPTPADAEPETTEPADPEPAATEETEPGDGATPNLATVTATDDGKDGKAERLASGALRGMVEDHLRDHPDEAFGPTAIATALGGKSSGAVSNALDKLVDDGVAVKTQDKPRRFALASAQQGAAAPPAN